MLSTKALCFLFLTTGFTIGFGHCIGMCGPIVVSLTLNIKEKSIVIPHLLYNLGRIFTYAVLGGIMGITGSFTGVTSNIAEIQKGVMIFAGALIVVMGLAMSGWVPLGRIFKDTTPLGGIVSRGFEKISNIKSIAAYFPLGLVLGLLPCGPVYTALIAAARAGMEAVNPYEGMFSGAVLMTAFGLGTVPALFLVGKLTGMGWLKFRAKIYQLGAVLMIAVGVYFIFQGFRY